jgi:hypothetical protein
MTVGEVFAFILSALGICITFRTNKKTGTKIDQIKKEILEDEHSTKLKV